ncbi:uncharacterized protein BDW47DRAFT_113317 [Aspergillus candidus]|uniref:Uncharacterized protein n=1 Tax=Aspergillus candidus TaxID=41067 RepID=A0A2I2EZP0_ASPCN|nr:hypothetical protein BDW47DRAFT_113317 [Aspergillus candidus]PLB33842.1 hypothetical protein BDW47DRAFT_113317 [Aspergillus candidus]
MGLIESTYACASVAYGLLVLPAPEDQPCCVLWVGLDWLEIAALYYLHSCRYFTYLLLRTYGAI